MPDENEIKKVFAKNLNHFLNVNQTSQIELAKYLNVSNTTVNNWVKGYKTPRMDKIDRLCMFFNINRSDLISETIQVTEKITNSDSMIITDKAEQSIIKKYRTLDERGKKTVNVVLDSYAELSQAAVKDEVG